MKLTEKYDHLFETKVFVVIKPTKHNVATLKKRGVYSDDSRYFFAMYDDVLAGKTYEKEMKDKWDQEIAKEFEKAGLKF